jgi:hypothetical protein
MSKESNPRAHVHNPEPLPAKDSSFEEAGSGAPTSFKEAMDSSTSETLQALFADPGFNEDLALALLQRTDLPSEVLERLSKSSVVTGRKVKLAIVEHPRTPRYASMSLLRQLFTFDLMQVALTPRVAGDIKVAAEEALLKRLESISPGARLSLARRASGRVAAGLLLDPHLRVMQAALENPRLTEALVRQALMRTESGPALVRAVCRHPKWSLRSELRLALLRSEKTPTDCALEIARTFTSAQLEEAFRNSRLPAAAKSSILSEVRGRARS